MAKPGLILNKFPIRTIDAMIITTYTSIKDQRPINKTKRYNLLTLLFTKIFEYFVAYRIKASETILKAGIKIEASKIINATKYDPIFHMAITPSIILEPVSEPMNLVYITGYKFEGK